MARLSDLPEVPWIVSGMAGVETGVPERRGLCRWGARRVSGISWEAERRVRVGGCQRGPYRSPACSRPRFPFSSVPGGAADSPVHHPGRGHHHGALCHRRALGTWCQGQRGGGRHRMLHVLPQLAPQPGGAAPAGPCRDSTTQATPQWPDRTMGPLRRLGTVQSQAKATVFCSGGLLGPPTAAASLGSGAPPQPWGPVPARTPRHGQQECPFSRPGPPGKGVPSAQLRARGISGSALACGVYAHLKAIS